MAKDEKETLDKVLKKPNDQDFLASMVQHQTEDFPSVSDIEVSSAYQDPFEVPKWCNQKDYAFAWVDLRDDIDRHRALETNYFKIVNRMSPCISGIPTGRDFRDHGAVERQGVFLVYRPKDLDDKLRTHAVLRHAEMVESISAGKSELGYETTFSKSKEDKGGSGIDVYAYEEAGEHAKTADDLKPGNLKAS